MALIQSTWNKLNPWVQGIVASRNISTALRTDPVLTDLGMKVVPKGSRQFVLEAKGIKAYWVPNGGHVDTSSFSENVMELPRDNIGFHIVEIEKRFRTRREVIEKLAVQAVRAQIANRLFTLFEKSGPLENKVQVLGRSSSHYGVSYMEKTLLAAGAINPRIIGTSAAIKLLDVTQPHLKVDIKDGNNESVLPNNRTFFVPSNAYKMVLFNSPETQFSIDNGYVDFQMKWALSAVIHHPELIRTIELLNA